VSTANGTAPTTQEWLEYIAVTAALRDAVARPASKEATSLAHTA